MATEPWVTAERVAQHLGVVKDTIYRWRERKGLPAHKIGRLWKFQLSEVDEWVRAGGADEDSGDHKGLELQEADTLGPATVADHPKSTN